ncbi:MAG: T9SS type A sorting domain-containing protein, partial [Hymenobacter sp.]
LVYPSPSTGRVNFLVTPTQTGNLTLDVYDLQGRLVRHLATSTGTTGVPTEYTLDGSTWAAGIYTVRLTTAGQTTHGKLVLVH